MSENPMSWQDILDSVCELFDIIYDYASITGEVIK